MGKKRSVGVVIAGITTFLSGAFYLFLGINITLASLSYSRMHGGCPKGECDWFWDILFFLWAPIYFLSSFYIFILKNLARKLVVIISAVICIATGSYILYYIQSPLFWPIFDFGGLGKFFAVIFGIVFLLHFMLIIFFTRSKVKEQFR